MSEPPFPAPDGAIAAKPPLRRRVAAFLVRRARQGVADRVAEFRTKGVRGVAADRARRWVTRAQLVVPGVIAWPLIAETVGRAFVSKGNWWTLAGVVLAGLVSTALTWSTPVERLAAVRARYLRFCLAVIAVWLVGSLAYGLAIAP